MFALLLLSGCWYSNGCVYTPQMINCSEQKIAFSSIEYYQKSSTIGKTNIKQRWKDAVACGAKNGDKHLFSVIEPLDNSISFDNCMIDKGYLILDASTCGLKSPKNMDKGLCN